MSVEVPESLRCRTMKYALSTDTGDKENLREVSVVHYNVLADAAIPNSVHGSDMCGEYLYCPEEYRFMHSKHGRHKRIIAEIASLASDIVTFNEIETEHFYDHLLPDMKNLGYSSVHHLHWFDHLGLIIFFKSDRFGLISEKSFIQHRRCEVMLDDLGVDSKVAKGVAEFMKEASTYPNIALPPGCVMANLQCKETGFNFSICNIHTTWKSLHYPIMQILQASSAMTEFHKFSGGNPCILAGDFNSPPELPLYTFMTSGKVCEKTLSQLYADKEFYDVDTVVQGQKLVDIIQLISLPRMFKSSYQTVAGREPHITNCDGSVVREGQVGMYMDCLDYIWYTEETFKPTAVLEVPARDVIVKHEAMPSVVFPSDHLPLHAKFQYKYISNGNAFDFLLNFRL